MTTKPNVQTVSVTDRDVMRLALDALQRGHQDEAQRLLGDRLAWYVEVAAGVQAMRRGRRPS